MKIQTESYKHSLTQIPDQGQHIIAHQQQDLIVVYQAYNHTIADFAVQHQFLGGSAYSYNRMSWIKPNFLWMMFRCGWAEKANQERVLAIWIAKQSFDSVLDQAVFSSFNAAYYESHELWKQELDAKEVRLQWDPDHDPYGNKLVRRAIQLGLKGKSLENFGKRHIQLIEDITDFVKQQHQFVQANQLDKLLVPVERVYKIADISLSKRMGISM